MRAGRAGGRAVPWFGIGPASLLALTATLHAASLSLPPRPAGAPGGVELVRRWRSLDLPAREREAAAQILAGNVPGFLRQFRPVTLTNVTAGATHRVTLSVCPDYLAVGSDDDYLLLPLSPATAQRVADAAGCLLPTRKMVDAIFSAAEVRLEPAPIPPSPAMTTVEVFAAHNAVVRAQRAADFAAHPPGALTAGHKKDVVIAAGLATAPGKVAIYGWHRTNGSPIQPLYLGHVATWVDYSQCVRLVSREVAVDGVVTKVAEILADPARADWLSDEGVIANPRYPTNTPMMLPARAGGAPLFTPPAWAADGDERNAAWSLDCGVRVRVNAPATPSPAAPVRLVLYVLPNGSSIEQTFGRKMDAVVDPRFDWQQIGAQTRFVRHQVADCEWVVAYLESDLKSWPAWRRKHGDTLIPDLVAGLRGLFPGRRVEVVLTGHSGGGSLTFGYLNEVREIPDEIVRIAFLDSNYGYDPSLGHQDKLVRWLKGGANRALCVLAYDDAAALLDGKPFVTAAGGTWGKSHEMLRGWAGDLAFTSTTNGGFETSAALDGRVRFILRQNPERKILHTVQVERNGFIHALLIGTTLEGRGYEYFGDRAYSAWIR